MRTDGQDVVTSLLSQRDWHVEQVRLIEIALSAIRGEAAIVIPQSEIKKSGEPLPVSSVLAKTRKISWKNEINKILSTAGYEPFTVGQMIEWLCSSNFTEAAGKRGKNAVNTTLNRMADDGAGEIIKVNPGMYQKKQVEKQPGKVVPSLF